MNRLELGRYGLVRNIILSVMPVPRRAQDNKDEKNRDDIDGCRYNQHSSASPRSLVRRKG